ncbi:TonB-dependent receptor domain-containing protein [Ursidibacter maritimus]|uniref:TonB-dependent receptor domain-containing protein n=1 Tax=Ursidibacter maritimus TaxID=1331689 RepID=UPI0021CDF2DA|nr:TonB-dependent receptor [Ursidibacter maritimus]
MPLMLKFDFTPNNANVFKLNLQHYDLTSGLNDLYSLGNSPRYNTHAKTNHQKNQRNAFALSHELHHENPLFDTLNWQVSLQNTKSQMTQQTDRTVPKTQKRELWREGDDFKTTMLNFKMDLNKSVGELIVNDFNYGLNLQQSKVQSLRYRQEKTLAFFPTQKQMQAKLYLSDRVSFGTSGISLTPSVHLTHIKIKPKKENLTEQKVQELFNYSRTALGYGLRADYSVNQAQLLSLNYHHATRLPGYGENNVQSYGHWGTRPNPNLKPEISDGLEFTWRSEGEWGKQTTTLFYNRYRDLIFLDMSECGSTFNQNVPCDLANQKGKSRVYGIEFDGKLNLDMLGLAKGMTLNTGFSYGKDKDSSGKPRGYIDPLTGFVALAYTQPDDIWGVEAKVKFAAAKKVKDMPKSKGWERLPGYGVLDITAHYNVTQNLHIDVGVYNALDKQYAVWGKARGAISNGDYRRHTEAGRHFGANVSYKF